MKKIHLVLCFSPSVILKCHETLILTDVSSFVMDIGICCYFQIEFGSLFCTADCFSKSYPTKPNHNGSFMSKKWKARGSWRVSKKLSCDVSKVSFLL